jgi:hypothetical protein
VEAEVETDLCFTRRKEKLPVSNVPDSAVRPSGNVVWKEAPVGSVQSKMVKSGPYYEQSEGTKQGFSRVRSEL